MTVSAVILAAGKGTRMNSKLAKVLHKLNGKTMVQYVIDACSGAGVEQVVLVVGHQRDAVKSELGESVDYAVQEQQLGTGHAVMEAAPQLKSSNGTVLVLCGDTPLLTEASLSKLIKSHQESGSKATVLTCDFENPTGYGRVIRNAQGQVSKIVEEKDASDQEKKVTEINSGTYCFNQEMLNYALNKITPANAQGEYYLPDVIEVLVSKGDFVSAVKLENVEEIMGINNRVQLAEASAVLRQRKLNKLMEAGVTIVDPNSTYIEELVEVGPDTIIEPNVVIKGKTNIGSECNLGPNTRIEDSAIGEQTNIDTSVVLRAKIGDRALIGPFAYVRPETVLEDEVKIGDFVEVKKSHIGKGSKVPHHSYIGDAIIGKSVNIGAGTITCNYDGYEKYKTEVEDGAFIGSNTNLVAPVKVGKKATVGAGSTITKDVPDNSLSVARSKQKNIENWSKK
ncbi:bifunctional UDP-N-acetylglucosamine pyrophosphorylase/glucosamine-1-phosphate N-acetyltransferase [Desulfitispora alkaliphila]|uniref:bifunctional UDP-N-acetylglucosamine diphosphorylase/glucosamine-1-phosphate N-acetyltransferase GlmU n=1 Tax=Desulfitispora alkaliphila TaxID=622674 RepID=UPI003D1923AD